MVRARLKVTFALLLTALGTRAAAAQDTPRTPAPTPLERRPYAIRASFAVDPSARLDDEALRDILDRWQALVRRFVGAPWALEVAPADGPFAALAPEDLRAADFEPRKERFDKLWAIRIEPGPRRGLRLAGREYDTLTRTLGTVARRDVPVPADFPRELLRFTRDLFTPTAEIGPSVGDRVKLTIQASGLVPAVAPDPVAPAGTVFVPLRLFLKPDGSINRILPIGWTYLVVREHDGPAGEATLITGLPDPLSRRVVGSVRMVAVGARPGDVPTRLRFETRPPDPQPAAGYTLVVRDAPNGTPREAGASDREGRIELPPGYSRGVVIARLLAGGIEPLVEFPILPGETDEERVIRVNPLPETVALETRLNALKDEVVDLVAVRARLESRIKLRADAGAWDEVKPLLDEFRKLPKRKAFEDRLNELRNEATRQQEERKVAILTRTAQAQVADVEGLITRYLDDELFQAYETAYNESLGGAVTAPSADWKPLQPPNAGLTALMPGTPAPGTQQFAVGTGNVPMRTWSTRHQERTYLLGLAEAPAGFAGPDQAATRSTLERLGDLLIQANPNFQLAEQKQIATAGLLGLELRLVPKTAAGATANRSHRSRLYLAPAGRIILLSTAGAATGAEARNADIFFNSFKPLDAAPKAEAKPATPAPAPKAAEPPKAAPKPAAPAQPKKAAEPTAKGAVPF